MSKQKNDHSELFLLFTLMSAILILSMEANNYQFSLFNYKIGFDIFIYPLSFLVANLTIKKYGDNKAVFLIIFSALILFGYLLFEGFLLTGNTFKINLALANLGSFVISQTANLIIYNKLLEKKQLNLLTLSLLYVIVITLDSTIKIIAIFSLIHFTDQLLFYMITNCCKAIIALFLAFIELKTT